MPTFKIITPPAIEPVSLSEAKVHLRIDNSNDDTLITSLITAARQWVENYTNRALINQTGQLWLDMLPAQPEGWWDGVREGPISASVVSFINLPRPPLVSVSSVKTFDENDTATIWETENYFVDTANEPGRLCLRTGAVWPSINRSSNGFCVEYIAGYGSAASTVPQPFKTAILQLITHWYEHRGDEARGEVPIMVMATLASQRVRFRGV